MDKQQTTKITLAGAAANMSHPNKQGKDARTKRSIKHKDEKLKEQQPVDIKHYIKTDTNGQTKFRQGPTAGKTGLVNDATNRQPQPLITDNNKNSNSKVQDKAQKFDQNNKKTSSPPTKPQPVKSTKKKPIIFKEPEHTPVDKRPLEFQIKVDQALGRQLSAFLEEYGLDDMHNYYVLSSESFVKDLTDYYACCLCRVRERINNSVSIDSHIESKKHILEYMKLRSSILKNIPKDGSLHSSSIKLLLDSWIQENSLTTQSCEQRTYACSEFCTALAEISPECQVRIIGSFFTGASLVDSDVNLEVEHPTTNLFESDPRAKDSIHHKLIDPDAEYGDQINNHTLHYDLIDNAVDTLYKFAIYSNRGYSSVKTFTVQSTIEDLLTKVPELVLRHEPTGTILRVCCYAESSYKLACLLRTYLSLDERASELCILVKTWARICKISDVGRGTFSADTLVILVIHFLQRTEPPILPCLHELLGKNGQSKSEDTVKRSHENLVDKFDNLNLKQPNCDKEEFVGVSNGTSDGEILDSNLDLDPADDELEEEDDEDGICYEFDSSLVENLEWSTENKTTTQRLFIEFLQFSMEEFANINKVISIRSLGTVRRRSKGWNTEVKAIENPVKPKLNLSRTIGTKRVFDYIRQCFAYGYYYLTSLPVLTRSKMGQQYCRNDPTEFSQLFVDLKRLDFYFEMRFEKIRNNVSFDSISEMIQQDIFARDVDTIRDTMEHFVVFEKNLENMALTFARSYDVNQLIPLDVKSTNFCWSCRKFGHSRTTCPDKIIEDLSSVSYEDPIDIQVNFDNGFLTLYTNDMITHEIAQIHSSILQQLRETIRTGLDLDCELTLFGSTVNLLGSHDSDLDICMTLEGNSTGRGVDCAGILKDVCDLLTNNEHVQWIEPILSARVPIIKFSYDKFDVDLSMYNQCAIHNSRLLRAYVMIDTRLAQLFYLVKRYAKSCGIADASRGSLSSYAWSLLVIHFMQHTDPPMLPVLQEPPNGQPKIMFGVNGWNVWFNENIESISMPRYKTNLTTLFKQFLLYYANFDFNLRVVSIRTSKTINKFQKNWHNCMIAIEDPFELTYNLSGRLDEPMALYIRKSFSNAYNTIYRIQKNYLTQQNTYPKLSMVRRIFDGKAIMGMPPPYRGCRLCHRIGHRVKECPEKQRKDSRQMGTNAVRPRGR